MYFSVLVIARRLAVLLLVMVVMVFFFKFFTVTIDSCHDSTITGIAYTFF
jgi:hypothetical protein